MRHMTYGEKSLFLDDEIADLLMEYAKLLAGASGADTVTVPAIGAEGNVVRAQFLLTPATVLMSESADSHAMPPGDEMVAAYLRERIHRLSATNEALPEAGPFVFEEEDEFS